MMKRLDKVEAEADRRGGIASYDIDEEDEYEWDRDAEEEVGEEDHWGVRSENDVRRSSASASSHQPHNRKDSYSFDIDRSNLVNKPRNRSGSLSSILGVGLGNGRNNSRKSSNGSNGGNHSKYSSAEDSSRLHGRRESDMEGDGKKVVVIEVSTCLACLTYRSAYFI